MKHKRETTAEALKRLEREAAELEAERQQADKRRAIEFWAHANKVSPGMQSLMNAMQCLAKKP